MPERHSLEHKDLKQDLNTLDTPTKVAGGVSVKRLQFGIFNVAYAVEPWKLPSCIESLKAAGDGIADAWVFIREVYTVAPVVSMTLVAVKFLKSFVTATSLYVVCRILAILETVAVDGPSADELQLLVISWIIFNIVSGIIEHADVDVGMLMMGHLKGHFMPKIVEAYNRLDYLQAITTDHEYYIEDYGYDTSQGPGWKFIDSVSVSFSQLFTLLFEIGIVLNALSDKDGNEVQIFACCALAYILLVYLTPSNGVYRQGYMYWTTNPLYLTLASLYRISLFKEYRADLVKDGTAKSISDLFKQNSQKLGTVKPYASVLFAGMPRAWYWRISDMFIEFPLGLYLIHLPHSLSRSSLSTMVLFYLISHTLQRTVWALEVPPINLIRTLYGVLRIQGVMPQGSAQYPDPIMNFPGGMDIYFSDVSFRYPADKGTSRTALERITIHIKPGQFVVVVGPNGSGKSTFSKLLYRLMDPTSGTIFVDGKPMMDYDASALRSHMAILSQRQILYPVSLNDNIRFGLPEGMTMTKEKVDKATRSGGSSELIMKLGSDTFLEDPPVYNMSGNGSIPPIVDEVLKEATGFQVRRDISEGERQRLAASRIFLRLQNSDIRFLLLDEPMAALDPIAELNMMDAFRKLHQDKTMIVVSHRFAHLVKHADLILCIVDGRLVESGTHEELAKNVGGEYMRLYNAQGSECTSNE